MILLSSIIQQFEAQCLHQYRDQLLPSHRKVLSCMKHCRTRYSPRMLVECCECDQRISVPHSCGDRHCPRRFRTSCAARHKYFLYKTASIMKVNNGWNVNLKSRCPRSIS